MNQEIVEKIIQLRENLIQKYSRVKDYKTNKNALMKEVDHAKILHETISEIDNILKDHVNFK